MAKRSITMGYYEKLSAARNTLCGYCEADLDYALCEKCIVTSLMDSADVELRQGLLGDDEEEDNPE